MGNGGERLSNKSSFEKIIAFVNTMDDNGLFQRSEWSEEEITLATQLSSDMAPALPKSIAKITLPNGGHINIGNNQDSDRIVEWNIKDLQKYAINLAKTNPLDKNRAKSNKGFLSKLLHL